MRPCNYHPLGQSLGLGGKLGPGIEGQQRRPHPGTARGQGSSCACERCSSGIPPTPPLPSNSAPKRPHAVEPRASLLLAIRVRLLMAHTCVVAPLQGSEESGALATSSLVWRAAHGTDGSDGARVRERARTTTSPVGRGWDFPRAAQATGARTAWCSAESVGWGYCGVSVPSPARHDWCHPVLLQGRM